MNNISSINLFYLSRAFFGHPVHDCLIKVGPPQMPYKVLMYIWSVGYQNLKKRLMCTLPFLLLQRKETTAPTVDLAQLLPDHGRVNAKALMQDCRERDNICLSPKKSWAWPILYGKLLYKLGQDFLDREITRTYKLSIKRAKYKWGPGTNEDSAILII